MSGTFMLTKIRLLMSVWESERESFFYSLYVRIMLITGSGADSCFLQSPITLCLQPCECCLSEAAQTFSWMNAGSTRLQTHVPHHVQSLWEARHWIVASNFPVVLHLKNSITVMFYLLFKSCVSVTFRPWSGNLGTNFYFFPGGQTVESGKLDQWRHISKS